MFIVVIYLKVVVEFINRSILWRAVCEAANIASEVSRFGHMWCPALATFECVTPRVQP